MEFLSERVNKALDSLQILKKNKTKSTESRKKLVKTQNWHVSSLEERISSDIICYIALSNMTWLYISRSLFYYFIDDYFSRTLYAAFRLLVNTCSKNISIFGYFQGVKKKGKIDLKWFNVLDIIIQLLEAATGHLPRKMVS